MNAPNLAPKPVSASQAEMIQLVLPSDANTLGNALGGFGPFGRGRG